MTLNDLFQVQSYWGKLPESKSSGAYKHCFQYLIGYTIPGTPYDWSILTVYFNTYANHLLSCFQILTNMPSMWNPSTLHLSTFWHLKFSHEKRFFKKWAYLSIWKDGYRLPPSFFLPFLAHSLFYCLLAFFHVRTDRKSGTGLGLTSFLVLIVVSFFLRCSTKLVKLGQLDYL